MFLSYQRNINYKFYEISLYPSQNGCHHEIKRPQILVRIWKEKEYLQTADGAVNWFTTTEVRVEVSHTMKALTNIWSSCPTPGHISLHSQGNLSQHTTDMLVNHAHCSTIRNSQDVQPINNLDVHQQIKRIDYISYTHNGVLWGSKYKIMSSTGKFLWRSSC